MITRVDYLKEPERWANTIEEKELVDFCIDWINNNSNFHYKFSPDRVNPLTKELLPNKDAKNTDVYYLILSKGVLEVYYARIKKNIKRSEKNNKRV